MTEYHVHLTAAAQRDLGNAADHIEFVLKNPQAADDLLDEAEEQLATLSKLPKRYTLVDDPVLSSWGIRFIAVKNYLAFYLVDEDSLTVHVVRFLYGKRDWAAILKHGVSIL